MAQVQLDARQQNAMRVFLVAYVLLVAYTIATGNPLASLVVDAVFSAVMVVIGYLIFSNSGGRTLPVTTGVAFVGSGVAQAVELVTKSEAAGTTSNVLLVSGLGLYLYSRIRQR